MYQGIVKFYSTIIFLVFLGGCLSYGPERIFVVDTSLVNDITDASCSVSGVIIDLGEKPINQHGFCYSTNPDPSIEKNEGIVDLGKANAVGEYSTIISGLSPETTYYIRAFISNYDLSTYGKVMNFTTSKEVKVASATVTTIAAKHILESSAVLGGEVTGDGGESVMERGIYYSTSSDPVNNGTKVAIGMGLGVFSTTISGLASNTQYFFAAFATNSNGTSFGATLNFITDEKAAGEEPIVATATANNIKETSATLGGEVTGDGGESITDRGIYYSTSSDPGNNETKVNLGVGLGVFSTEITGLAGDTEYYYTAYASNSIGTGFGAILSFTTGQSIVKPTVTTTVASEVSETSATIGGNVTSQGGAPVTERGIFYGTSSDPINTGAKILVGSGTDTFSTTLSGLIDGTRYYYVAFATNSAGTSYGTTLSFNTTETVVPPSVTTSSAVSVTETTAVVGGNVTDGGGGIVTERGIYYGTSSDPKTTGAKLAIGTDIGPFSATLSGLIDATRYYYVAYATNSSGTSYGTTLSFTTLEPIVLPSVSTVSATSITEITAIVGGNVSNSGGGTVTERGIYYGTSSNPVSNGTKIALGDGTGPFSTTLNGLIDGTKYYYVAYATNSAGSNYGNILNFTTDQTIVKPSVTTSSASSIAETMAVLGGNVTNGGGGTVTERGIYYGTSSDPKTNGTKVQIGSGTGPFSKSLSGLADGTKYYFVAFASNSAGVGYGSTLSFTTAVSNTVTDVEGNVYQTVVIGDQRWMAENLKTRRYSDGSWLTLVESSTAWDGLGSTSKAYCYYDNDASNANTYGALYTWPAAMNGVNSSDANPSGIQGVCPSGWHLPSDEEWKQLEMHLGMSRAQADNTEYRGTDEGGKLKETGYTHWESPNTGATNSSGFSALAGGYRLSTGIFGYFNSVAAYWTSTHHSSDRAMDRALHHDGSQVYRRDLPKSAGYSVRCIRDE